jgi:hypothetical protein
MIMAIQKGEIGERLILGALAGIIETYGNTLAAHFGYGAASGTVFTVAGMHKSRLVEKGMAWGIVQSV